MLGVLVVALKYGAKQAALALRQELDQYKIWTTLIWVQADLLEDRSLINFIGSAIDMIKNHAECESKMVQKQMNSKLREERKSSKLTNGGVGCFVSKHTAKQITWNPHPDHKAQWIERGTNNTSAVDVEFLKDLSGLHMQSSDLQHIEGIKQKLTVGEHRALAVRPVKVDGAESVYTRCQAVALHVFASLILEGLHFSEVRRIANRDDLQKAQKLVQNIAKGTRPILLWVDMLEGLPALTKADTDGTFQYKQDDNDTDNSDVKVIRVNGEARSVNWGGTVPDFIENEVSITSVDEVAGLVKLGSKKEFTTPTKLSWNNDLSVQTSKFRDQPNVHLLLTSDISHHANLNTVVEKYTGGGCYNDLCVQLPETGIMGSESSIKACAHHEEIR